MERHITKERGFLSYPSTAIVTVFAKGALLADEGEFWEAEVSTQPDTRPSSHLREDNCVEPVSPDLCRVCVCVSSPDSREAWFDPQPFDQ